MKNYPLVSIISPNYNGGKYLDNYLSSILNQTYSNIELVITDDCSTDNSLSIIKSYADKFKEKGYNLIVSKLEKNSGAAACLNVCLKNVHGEYLIWMDSDDILYNNAIVSKVKYMLEHPDIEFLIGQGDIVQDSNIYKVVGSYKRVKENNDNFFMDALKRKNMVYAAANIVKIDAFKRAIPTMHIFESRQGQNLQFILPLTFLCKYDYHTISSMCIVTHKNSHSRKWLNYKKRINREFEIFNIIKNTVNSINEADNIERERYIKIAEIDVLEKVVFFSCVYFRFFSAIKYLARRNKLKHLI